MVNGTIKSSRENFLSYSSYFYKNTKVKGDREIGKMGELDLPLWGLGGNEGDGGNFKFHAGDRITLTTHHWSLTT